MSTDTLALTYTNDKPSHGLDMMTFLETEGGRKCPMCGKYAKRSELGWIGSHGPGIIVDAYGHLPGFGCNKPEAHK